VPVEAAVGDHQRQVELRAVVAAVEVDRQLAGAGRQPVVEADPRALAGGATDGRAGEAAAEGPQPRLASGQDLLLGLLDRDPDPVAPEDRRDRERAAEGNRGERSLRLGAQRQTGAAAQRQQDRESAAAKGAEESSAPEAGLKCGPRVRASSSSVAAGP
jgi:hypothetical protein